MSEEIISSDDEHPRSTFYNSEIEEVNDISNINIKSHQPYLDCGTLTTISEDIIGNIQRNHEDNCVYVAVGKSHSSMDALRWTLRNTVDPSTTTLYLIHVFPQIRHVPSPLGNLPVSQVNRDQLESFKTQESNNRRQLLQNYLQTCHSYKVKVDTILIESDTVAKAIADLIPVLNVGKLVVGISKASLRKLRDKKGNVVAAQILHNETVNHNCDIKIICDGNEVVPQQLMKNQLTPALNLNVPVEETQPEANGGSISCMCFGGKFT